MRACQKQPCTDTATRRPGRTTSGQPGRSLLCSRNRNPAANSALRTTISGFVFRPPMPDIIRLLVALVYDVGHRVSPDELWNVPGRRRERTRKHRLLTLGALGPLGDHLAVGGLVQTLAHLSCPSLDLFEELEGDALVAPHLLEIERVAVVIGEKFPFFDIGLYMELGKWISSNLSVVMGGCHNVFQWH